MACRKQIDMICPDDHNNTLWKRFEHLSLREKHMLAIYRMFNNL
jgi:hypothetical protein